MWHKMSLCIFRLEKVTGILYTCRSNTESKPPLHLLYIFLKFYYSLAVGIDITKSKSTLFFIKVTGLSTTTWTVFKVNVYMHVYVLICVCVCVK